LEVQIVTRDPGDGLCVEPCEPRDAVVLVHDDVARPELREASKDAAPASALGLLLLSPAPKQPVLGDDGQVKLRGDEACLQTGLSKNGAGRPLVRSGRRPFISI